MKHVYLALCIAGAVVPYIALGPWIAEHGLDLPRMMRELFVNRVSAFFGLDVIISALVVCVFAYAERRRLRRRWWMPVAGVVLVGVSLGLPLLLYLREVAQSTEP
jgi:Terpene cyclase DEP1